MSSTGKSVLVRAASSATIAVLLFSALLLYGIFKDGWSTTRLTNATYFLSGLWIVGWPFGIAMLASKSLGAAWGKQLVTGSAPDTSAAQPQPPSATLAIVGAAFFALSVLALGGMLLRNIVRVVQESQPQALGGPIATRDSREPPALPESFSASTGREALMAELELDDIWSTSHPEYDGDVRILIASAPVEGLSPNYRAAFYRREGDSFIRVGKGFSFGGYHPPELGRHPTLDLPAIVCLAEAIPEHTYFFVHEGASQTLQENDETWRPVEEPR